MAVRLELPDYNDTKALVQAILTVIHTGDRAMFFTRAGEGASVIQRVRMMISRKREELRKDGIVPQKFIMHSTIFPYTTLAGVRMDCVVAWKFQSTKHQLQEKLEVMLND